MRALQQWPPGAGSVDDKAPTISVVRVSEAIVALELEGEFDVAEAESLNQHVDRLLDRRRDVIIDLSSTTFIDSSVIHALFRAEAGAQAIGRNLVVQLGTASGVSLVLSITGADRNLATVSSREQAIALLDGSC